MTNPVVKHFWLALTPLLLAGACDWLWPLEGEYDPHRCAPRCQGAQTCRNGQCVGPGADGAPQDGALPKKDGQLPHKDITLVKKDGPQEDTPPGADQWVPGPDQTPACVQGTLSCLGGGAIKYCEKGAWQTSTCTVHCKGAGYDFADGCRVSLGGKDSCVCAKKTGYGAVCTSSGVCGSGFFCRLPVSWIAGICTRSCLNDVDCGGGPPGTLAKCNICLQTPMGPIRYCEFMCGKYNKPCPALNTCDTATDRCLPTKLPPN